jgi:hypothetical protein
MSTTMAGEESKLQNGQAAPGDAERMPGGQGLWTQQLAAWLTRAVYRPERHYMRGGHAGAGAATQRGAG